MRLRILGPLRLWREGVEVEIGPRQRAYLLALLLARQGRPTSAGELINLMWDGAAPASALNVIHKYVGSLRRLLEPELPARSAGTFLLRRGDGYLCTAGPGLLDLADFRQLTEAAGSAVTEGRNELAMDRYESALDLWTGPAGGGLLHGPSAAPVFTALDDEFVQASITASVLAVAMGQPKRVLRALHLAAAIAPLHEPVQASLIALLGAAGQRAEALAVFGDVRRRLAEELGIDPGPVLQEAFQRVLSDRAMSHRTGRSSESALDRSTAHPTESRTGTARSVPSAAALVGRTSELAQLRRTVEAVLDGGAAIALVEGEPGIGKSSLLEDIAAGAAARGARAVWGRCLDGAGTPSMWPWIQAVGTLLDHLPSDLRQGWLEADLGHLIAARRNDPVNSIAHDSHAQFRLFEQAVAAVAQSSALRPVILLLDDLQWADASSLQLLEHLLARLPARTGVLCALRSCDPAPGRELARTLAVASRVPDHRRMLLEPLAPAQVGQLVRRETGQDISPDAARSVHDRTAGNPLLVLELARSLAGKTELTAESVASSGVPTTVRDIVRDRMTGLEPIARELLDIAAVVGRTVDINLLARVADLDVDSCMAYLEPVQALGIVGPTPDDPFTYQFVHDLVRQGVSGAATPRQVAATHLRIADALEHIGTDGDSLAERVAHHLWRSGPLADPARAAAALIRAGRGAMAKTALQEADHYLRSAVELARSSDLLELELSALSQLIAVAGMRSMYGASCLALVERAAQVARGLGRERQAAGLLYSRWAAHAQGIELHLSGPLARRLLAEGDASYDPIVRAYGLQAWGIHLWDIGCVGDAFRYLSRSNEALLGDLDSRDDDPVRHDLRLLILGMLAETAALHGRLDHAREVLDRLVSSAGVDPYSITVEATFSSRIAVLAGDPQRAQSAAERGFSADPALSFEYLGTYQRLARHWAAAMTGSDPAGEATKVARLIERHFLHPPRSCVATWYGLLAEMWMAADGLNEATVALDKADACVRHYGQRYAQSLLILLRAVLLRATGESKDAVRRLAERARQVAVDDEAHLIAMRAGRFIESLESPTERDRPRRLSR